MLVNDIEKVFFPGHLVLFLSGIHLGFLGNMATFWLYLVGFLGIFEVAASFHRDGQCSFTVPTVTLNVILIYCKCGPEILC